MHHCILLAYMVRRFSEQKSISWRKIDFDVLNYGDVGKLISFHLIRHIEKLDV